MSPLFSIIIVSLNAENSIKRTIHSALNQTYSDVEILIKDGCSTDSTLCQIPQDEKIRVFQSKDTGIYDAMNQAIELASGKYLYFLNCGDVFANEKVLADISNVISQHSLSQTPAVIYGDYRRNDIVFRMPKKLYDFYLFRTPLNHQSMFISKIAFNKHGLYNTKFKISADHEHTLRTFRGKSQFLYAGITICDYLGGGLSEAYKNLSLKNREYNEIVKLYFSRHQQILYGLIIFISLKKLRGYLISDKRPKFVRVMYNALVNRINQGY